MTGRELARIVEQHGWRLLRIHGSHHVYGKPGVNVRLTIPIHGNRDLKKGTLKQLLKAAGISEGDIR